MKLVERVLTYDQDKDCCDSVSAICQLLTIRTQDGGGGSYVVIETDRWAIDRDDIDKFCQTLKDILNGLE